MNNLYSCKYIDLVLDKADLAGIVIHKWVPTHGIYFFVCKILHLVLPAEHQNLATGPYNKLGQ